MKKINAKGRRVLVIPDLHIPYHHPDAFNFLSEVKKKYLDSRSIIVNLGDEIDGHAISFHDKDPDMPFTPAKELEKSIEYIADLEEIFPKKYLLESNHGSLVYRRQKHAGLPRHVMKSYNEILGVKKWNWFEEIILNTNLGDIYLCHGKTSSDGKLSKEMGCSAIQGHFHGKFQVVWTKRATKDTFDAYSGCLVDRQHLAFAYGKNHIPKPVLGCMIISKMGYPKMIKMITNHNNRWIKELP